MQAAQFQSGNQQGARWHWDSKCTAAGNCDSAATPENNELAQMPRGYIDGDPYKVKNYFNWYAVTAESGTYSMQEQLAGDSLCPRGWMLPRVNTNSGKSWDGFISSEGLTNENFITFFRKSLINADYDGFYGSGTGVLGGGSASFQAPVASSNNIYSRRFFYYSEHRSTSTTMAKTQGGLVRCIQK